MADRTDHYFRQRVTEAELDLGFELLEQADRNLASDIGLFGIVSGAVPVPHVPVADLTIDLDAPGRAYDRLGQRIFFGSDQRVDCSVDTTGVSTDIDPADGEERWLSVSLRFDRLLSDERTDGNGQRIFFRRDEGFELVVRQGPPAAAGAAPRLPLQQDELLVCDVLRRSGQTQIVQSDIDTSRRQAFVFAQGDSVGVFADLWRVLNPGVPTMQATLDDLDATLDQHFTAGGRRHDATAIDYAPTGFLSEQNVKAALDQLVALLSATAANSPGASRIGADAVPGTPNALAASNVDQQLAQLLAWLNVHLGDTAGAHAGSAISANPFSWVTGTSVQQQLQQIVAGLRANRIPASAFGTIAATNVQAQLQEIVGDLAGNAGATLVQNTALTGTPYSVGQGTVRGQLQGVLNDLNTHAASDDHDDRYLRVVFSEQQTIPANNSVTIANGVALPSVVTWTVFPGQSFVLPQDSRISVIGQKQQDGTVIFLAANSSSTPLDTLVTGYTSAI